MKQLIRLLFVFLIVLTASTSFALVNTSFRKESTAGLLEDDFDLWISNGDGTTFDPAGLTYISGSRLYSNLSNFVDHQENLFSNGTNNTFLIGGSTHHPLGSGGLLYDRFSQETPDLTGIHDTRGHGEEIISTFEDTDNNGAYDTQRTVERSADAGTVVEANNMIVGFARESGLIRWGILYSRIHDKTESWGGDDNFSFSTTDQDLITNTLSFVSDSTGTGRDLTEGTEDFFAFSMWRPWNDRLDVGFQAGAGWRDEKLLAESEMDLLTDYSPTEAELTDLFTFTNRTISTTPRDGVKFYFGGSGLYDWTEKVKTRLDLSYIRTDLKIDTGAMENHRYTDSRLITLGSGLSSLSHNNVDSTAISGKYKEDFLDFFSKTIVTFADDVILGFGLRVYTSKVEDIRTLDRQAEEVETFDDGDTQEDDFDDFTETRTWSEVRDSTVSSANTSIALPVGIEFGIKKKWVMRFGAIYDLLFSEEITTSELISSSPAVVVTERGDGTTVEDLESDVVSQTDGTREREESRTSTTTYTYGLGYEVSENLQIDLMGFSDLTDLTDWRLSATVRF